MDVNGRVAVITGGASGIGRGIARTFAAQGMKLVLADIEQGPLDETVAEFTRVGTEAIGVRTDVSKLDQIEALAARTLDRFGAAHVLCNNAGIGMSNPVGATSMADWKWTLDVDLWGPINGVHVFLPIMERQGEGHISSTASMAGLYAGASLGAYNVAKHGVVALMASLERDLRLAGSPLHASVLCPGPINTSIVDSSRNRPADSAADYVETDAGRKFWDILSRTLADGMDPDDVGPMVLDAVVNDRFWILTHPEMAQVVSKQVERMQTNSSLTR